MYEILIAAFAFLVVAAVLYFRYSKASNNVSSTAEDNTISTASDTVSTVTDTDLTVGTHILPSGVKLVDGKLYATDGNSFVDITTGLRTYLTSNKQTAIAITVSDALALISRWTGLTYTVVDQSVQNKQLYGWMLSIVPGTANNVITDKATSLGVKWQLR